MGLPGTSSLGAKILETTTVLGILFPSIFYCNILCSRYFILFPCVLFHVLYLLPRVLFGSLYYPYPRPLEEEMVARGSGSSCPTRHWFICSDTAVLMVLESSL